MNFIPEDSVGSTFFREDHEIVDNRRKKEKKPSIFVKFQENLYIFMIKTPAGFLLDMLQTFLSIFACGLYIAETYIEMYSPLPTGIIVVEFILAGCFIIDYLLHFLIADNFIAHFVSKESIVNLLAILPVFTILNDQAKIGFLRFYVV